MPAGKYWIGDPCYVFPHNGPMENKWDELLNEVDFFDTLSYGELDDGKIKVWAAHTAYGDGRYFGSNGKTFPVDAGLIGIVPLETVKYLDNKESNLDNCGLFIEFTKSFIVESRDGLFHFGNIDIDTKDDEEFDEEYEYDDDEYDYAFIHRKI